ncbi:hypothetical protein LguiB_020600 [Lonicera macranthoides]
MEANFLIRTRALARPDLINGWGGLLVLRRCFFGFSSLGKFFLSFISYMHQGLLAVKVLVTHAASDLGFGAPLQHFTPPPGSGIPLGTGHYRVIQGWSGDYDFEGLVKFMVQPCGIGILHWWYIDVGKGHRGCSRVKVPPSADPPLSHDSGPEVDRSRHCENPRSQLLSPYGRQFRVALKIGFLRGLQNEVFTLVKCSRQEEGPSTRKALKSKGKGKATDIPICPIPTPLMLCINFNLSIMIFHVVIFLGFNLKMTFEIMDHPLLGHGHLTYTHHSEFNVFDSLRLYAISTRLSIDLGDLIFKGIVFCLVSHHDGIGSPPPAPSADVQRLFTFLKKIMKKVDKIGKHLNILHFDSDDNIEAPAPSSTAPAKEEEEEEEKEQSSSDSQQF